MYVDKINTKKYVGDVSTRNGEEMKMGMKLGG